MSRISKISGRLSQRSRRWTIAIVVVLIGAGFFLYRYWHAKQTALPPGIASGNGRIESKQVDVSSKLPLKVKTVLAAEGDLVKPGQVLAKMDTLTLEAELTEAQEGVAVAREQLAVAKAAIA